MMAESSIVVLEGALKHRVGKKWKSRWCILKKLSPIADQLHLFFYRDAESSRTQQQPKSQVIVQNLHGIEHGFLLDKEPHTLCLICLPDITLLAFHNQECLINWQIQIRQQLGEEQQYPMQLWKSPIRLSQDAHVKLYIHGTKLCLATTASPPRVLVHMLISDIRSYGIIEGRLCLELSSKHGKRSGLYVLETQHGSDITQMFNRISQGKAPQPKKWTSSTRRSRLGPPSNYSASIAQGSEDTMSTLVFSDSGSDSESLKPMMTSSPMASSFTSMSPFDTANAGAALDYGQPALDILNGESGSSNVIKSQGGKHSSSPYKSPRQIHSPMYQMPAHNHGIPWNNPDYMVETPDEIMTISMEAGSTESVTLHGSTCTVNTLRNMPACSTSSLQHTPLTSPVKMLSSPSNLKPSKQPTRSPVVPESDSSEQLSLGDTSHRKPSSYPLAIVDLSKFGARDDDSTAEALSPHHQPLHQNHHLFKSSPQKLLQSTSDPTSEQLKPSKAVMMLRSYHSSLKRAKSCMGNMSTCEGSPRKYSTPERTSSQGNLLSDNCSKQARKKFARARGKSLESVLSPTLSVVSSSLNIDDPLENPWVKPSVSSAPKENLPPERINSALDNVQVGLYTTVPPPAGQSKSNQDGYLVMNLPRQRFQPDTDNVRKNSIPMLSQIPPTPGATDYSNESYILMSVQSPVKEGSCNTVTIANKGPSSASMPDGLPPPLPTSPPPNQPPKLKRENSENMSNGLPMSSHFEPIMPPPRQHVQPLHARTDDYLLMGFNRNENQEHVPENSNSYPEEVPTLPARKPIDAIPKQSQRRKLLLHSHSLDSELDDHPMAGRVGPNYEDYLVVSYPSNQPNSTRHDSISKCIKTSPKLPTRSKQDKSPKKEPFRDLLDPKHLHETKARDKGNNLKASKSEGSSKGLFSRLLGRNSDSKEKLQSKTTDFEANMVMVDPKHKPKVSGHDLIPSGHDPFCLLTKSAEYPDQLVKSDSTTSVDSNISSRMDHYGFGSDCRDSVPSLVGCSPAWPSSSNLTDEQKESRTHNIQYISNVSQAPSSDPPVIPPRNPKTSKPLPKNPNISKHDYMQLVPSSVKVSPKKVGDGQVIDESESSRRSFSPEKQMINDGSKAALQRNVVLIPNSVAALKTGAPLSYTKHMSTSLVLPYKAHPASKPRRNSSDMILDEEGMHDISPRTMPRAKRDNKLTVFIPEAADNVWVEQRASKSADALLDSCGSTNHLRQHSDPVETMSISSNSDCQSMRSYEYKASPAATTLRPRYGKEYRKIDRRKLNTDISNPGTPNSPSVGSVFTFDNVSMSSRMSSMSALSGPGNNSPNSPSITTRLHDRDYVNFAPRDSPRPFDMTPPASPLSTPEQANPVLNYAVIDLTCLDEPQRRPPKRNTRTTDIEYTMIDMVATAAASKASKEHAQYREDSLRRKDSQDDRRVLISRSSSFKDWRSSNSSFVRDRKNSTRSISKESSRSGSKDRRSETASMKDFS